MTLGAFFCFLRCGLLLPLARTGFPFLPGPGGADSLPFWVEPNAMASAAVVAPTIATGFCVSDCPVNTVRPLWPCCWTTGMLLADR